MKLETYERILKHLATLELDLEKGLVLNRNITKEGTDGYLPISLGDSRDRKMVKVHQVLAVARWGKVCVGMQVNHINEIKTDNSFNNIELLSPIENLKARTKCGSPKHSIYGTNIDTNEMHYFESIVEASNLLGLSHGAISRVVNGKQKRVGRYTFERVA